MFAGLFSKITALRWKALVASGVAVAAVATTTVVVSISGGAPVLEASDGDLLVRYPMVDESGDPFVLLGSDGLSAMPVMVHNTGSTPSASAGVAEIEIDLPEGVEFVELFDEAEQAMTAEWACEEPEVADLETSGVDVICRHRFDEDSPLLPPDTALALVAMLQTPDGGVNNKVIVTRASVSGIEGVAYAGARTVDDKAGRPAMLALHRGDVFVNSGGAGSSTVSVVNLGSGPSEADDGVSTTLDMVLPAGVITSWSSTGAQWECEGPQIGPVSCSTSEEVEVGEFVSPLTLDWTVEEIPSLRAGSEPMLVEWDSSSTSRGPRGVAGEGWPDSRTLLIAPPLPPVLHVRSTSDEANHVLPGYEVSFDVITSVQQGLAVGTQILVAVPDGLGFVSLEGADCDDGSALVTCDLGTVPPGPESTRSLTLAANLDAEQGPVDVTVTLSADGSDPQVIDHQVVVSSHGDPSIGGQLMMATASGLTPVVDGRDLVTDEDTALVFGVRVRNVGPVPIEAGTEAVVTWVQPAGTGAATVSAPDGGSCSSSGGGPITWTCTFELGDELLPEETGPIVDVSVAGLIPGTDVDFGLVTTDLSIDGHVPHTVDVRVDVEENASHLRPRLSASRLTAGGVGEVSVHLESFGAATEATPTLVAVLPDGMVPRPADDSGCVGDGSTLTCFFDPMAAGALSEVREIPVAVGSSAGWHEVAVTAADLRADGRFADRTVHSLTVDIEIGEALDTELAAWPAIVLPSADGEGTTVALAATSVARDGSAVVELGWRQRCVDDADVGVVPDCDVVTPRVEFIDGESATTRRVTIPEPTASVDYVFEYRMSDGSAEHAEFLTVPATTEGTSEVAASSVRSGGVEVAAADLSATEVQLAMPTVDQLPLDLGLGFTLTSITGSCPSPSDNQEYNSQVGTTVTFEGLSFTQTSFCNSNSFDISIIGSSGMGTFEIFDGLEVNASSFNGSFSSDGSLRVDATVNGSATFGPVSIEDVSASILATCTGFNACEGGWTVGGSASYTMPNGTTEFDPAEVTADGEGHYTVTLGNGTGSLFTTIGTIWNSQVVISNVPGGEIGSAGVSISQSEADGWRFVVTGAIDFAGETRLDVAAEYLGSDNTMVLAIDARRGIRLPSNAELSGVFVANQTSETVTVEIDGYSYTVGSNGQVVSGTLKVPDWFNGLTGADVSTVEVHGASTAGSTEVSAEVRGNYRIALPGNAVTLDFSDLRMEITYTEESGVWMLGVGGTAVVTTTGLMASTLTVEVDVASDGWRSLSGTLKASNGTWNNAFGIDGLVLSDLEIGLTFYFGAYSEMPPTVGLHATAQLPSSIAGPLGLQSGAYVAATVGLSEANPCLDIEIGNINGIDATALSVAGGVLTAKKASLVAAPTGCTVGSHTIEPGYAFAFDGTLMGDSVEVNAVMTLNPLNIDATVSLGAFSLAGFNFSNTELTFKTTPESTDLFFSGGVEIGGTTVNVTGQFDREGETTTIKGTVDLNTVTLGELRLSDFSLSMELVSGPDERSATFSGIGKLDILGVDVDVENIEVSMANAQIERMSATVDATVTVGEITFAGTFSGTYDRVDASQNTLHASVTARTGGFTMASGTLDLTEYSASFTADFDFGSMFSAQVSGTVVSKNAQGYVPIENADGYVEGAAPGDFRFEVDNLDMNIGAFHAEGSFAIGRVQNNPFASVDATLRLGVGHEQASVTVKGDINPNLSVDFSGSQDLKIAGFEVGSMSVSVKGNLNSIVVAASGSLNIDGAIEVTVSGEFSMQNGQPSATMTGTGSGSLGGFRVGSMSATLSQTPYSKGLSASVSISAGPISASGSVTYSESSNGIQFDASLNGRLSIPGLGIGVGVKFGNIGGYHFDITGTLSYSGFSWSVSWSVGTSGSFGFERSSSNSWSFSFGGHGWGGGASGGYTANIGFNQNGISANGSATGSAYGKAFGIKVSVGLSLDVEFDPFKVCGEINIAGHHHVCT